MSITDYTRSLFDRKKPTSDDRVIGRLKELVEEGVRHREHCAPRSETIENLKLYRGEYKTSRKAKGGDRPYAAANIIRAIVNRQASRLTDSQPILRVEAGKRNLYQAAQMLNTVMMDEWEQQHMQQQTYKMVHTAGITRSAGLNCRWDAKRQQMVLEVLRLHQLSVDPRIQDAALLDRAAYVDVRRIVPLAEVRQLFPVTGMAAKADAALNLEGDDFKKAGRGHRVRTVSDILYGNNSRGPLGEVEGCEVHETFILDPSLGEDPSKSNFNQPLYPTTRMITWTKDVVLKDEPNPYWHGLPTMEWFDWAEDPMHIFGHSEPSYLKHLQLPANQLLDELIQNKLLTNFVQIAASQDAVGDDEWAEIQRNLGSGALMIRTLNNQSKVDIQPPPTFGADDIQIFRMLIDTAQMLSGETSATMGDNSGSLQTGRAVEGIIEGANQMNRDRSSRLEAFYRRIGFKMMATILQYFPAERVGSISGPTGEAFEYIYQRSEFFVYPDPSDSTKLLPMSDKQRADALRDFRLLIEPGSSQPGARQHRAMITREMMKMGAASRKDILVAAGYPPWIADEMIKRANADPAVQALLAKGKGSDPKEG